MAFYFRLRFKFPDNVKNRGEAQIIVDTVRLQSRLPEFYDGQTIELIEEPTGILGKAWKQISGK